jgi:hypothetical protein
MGKELRLMCCRSSRFALLWSLLLVVASAPLSAAVLYDNGPINGNIGAWTVDGVAKVTNSFQLSSASIVTGIVFGAWAYPSRTGIWVDWAITSTPFGTPLASGESTLSNQFLFSNTSGADVSRESFTIPQLALGPGTYWLELDDTMTTNSRWFWWDQNNGPSQAQYIGRNGQGSIGSESFQILGSPAASPAVPEPGSLTLLGSGALIVCMALLAKRKSRS